jgi:DNA-binding IclR family transcriptional regulator
VRGDQLIRQWKMLGLLARHPEGLTVPMLCRALKAKVRASYRELGILQKAGFIIRKDRKREPLYLVPNPERQDLRASLRATAPSPTKPLPASER